MTHHVQTVKHTHISDTPEDTVVESPAENSYGYAGLAQRIVSFITGIILTLLAFRFLLSLLGANRSNIFADFIYGITMPLVSPFFGLFNYNAQYGVVRFEFETLVAILFYALVSWAIIEIINFTRHPRIP